MLLFDFEHNPDTTLSLVYGSIKEIPDEGLVRFMKSSYDLHMKGLM